jgi:hypothetical protein
LQELFNHTERCILRAYRVTSSAVDGANWAGLGLHLHEAIGVAQGLEIIPYTRDWIGSVRQFNDRLVAGGLDSELRFPEEPRQQFSIKPNGTLHQEHHLVVEGATVRGAYLLTHERWIVGGQTRHVCHFRLPVSEGLINRHYKGVGSSMLQHALQKNTLLYSLGMGCLDRPLPRMLNSRNWSLATTSFYFRCLRPGRVLHELVCLRTHPGWDFALDTGGWGGVGSLLISGTQHLRMRRPAKRFNVSVVRDFGNEVDEIVDEIQERSLDAYALLPCRDSEILRLRYPASDSRFFRLVVDSGSGPCGWVVVLATSMNGHKQFGDLRVGTIVDCLAVPGDEDYVIHAASRFLEEQEVDLIVSNQSHRNWRRAFEHAGFFSGTSNYIFAASPQLSRLLEPFASNFPASHLTRGNGAGPIHL